jgi:hypothetical protein
MIKLKCNLCNKEFEKNLSFYKQSLKRGYTNHFCSKKCSSEFRIQSLKKEGVVLKNNNKINYLLNPKKCLNCDKSIFYEKRFNKYCSSECSAIHTQKSGGNRKWNENEKEILSDRMIKFHLENPKIKSPPKTKKCKNCKKNVLEKHKQICKECSKQYYEFYRPLCEFKFRLEDYPEKFDLNLIRKYGRYSPKNKGNNLKGISRDHLYSVKDGFKNRIDTEIISHPANCKLVIHRENQNKYTKSDITIEELKNRILNWK